MGSDAVHLPGAAFPKGNATNSPRTVPTGPRSQGPARSTRNNQAQSQIPPINQPRNTPQAGAAVPYNGESFEQWRSRVTAAQGGIQPTPAELSKELTASQEAVLTCGNCAGKRGREGALNVTYSGFGHLVKDCTRLVDPDGFVNACPFCNKGDHNPNACKAAHTLTDAYYLLVVCRHGKPPIRCNWDLKALDPKRWEAEKFRPQNPKFSKNYNNQNGDQTLGSTIMAPLWTNGGIWIYKGFFGGIFNNASSKWRPPPKPKGGEQLSSTLGSNRTSTQQVGHLPSIVQRQTSGTIGPSNPQPSSSTDISGQASDEEQRDGRSVSLLAKLEQKLNSIRQSNPQEQHQGTTNPEPKRSTPPQLSGQGQQQGVLKQEQKLCSLPHSNPQGQQQAVSDSEQKRTIPPQPNQQRQQQAVLNSEPKRSSLPLPFSNSQGQQQRLLNAEQKLRRPLQSNAQTQQEVLSSELKPSMPAQATSGDQQQAVLSQESKRGQGQQQGVLNNVGLHRSTTIPTLPRDPNISDSIVRERMELEQEVEELEKLIKIRERRNELRKRLRALEDEEAELPSSKSRAVGERGDIRALGRTRGSSSPRRELHVATTQPAHMKEQAGGEENLGGLDRANLSRRDSRGDRYRPDDRRRRESRDRSRSYRERSRSRSRERSRILRSPSPERPSRDRVIMGAPDTPAPDSPTEGWMEAMKTREAQAKAYLAAQNKAREKARTDSRSKERERASLSNEIPATDPDPGRMRLADVSGRGLDRTSSGGTEGSDGRETVPALNRGYRSSSKEELPVAATAQTQDPIIKQEFAPHPSHGLINL
jgi:hypothetical protein